MRDDGLEELVWWWNGDADHPTVRNSINWVGVWHGWITNGRIVNA